MGGNFRLFCSGRFLCKMRLSPLLRIRSRPFQLSRRTVVMAPMRNGWQPVGWLLTFIDDYLMRSTVCYATLVVVASFAYEGLMERVTDAFWYSRNKHRLFIEMIDRFPDIGEEEEEEDDDDDDDEDEDDDE